MSSFYSLVKRQPSCLTCLLETLCNLLPSICAQVYTGVHRETLQGVIKIFPHLSQICFHSCNLSNVCHRVCAGKCMLSSVGQCLLVPRSLATRPPVLPIILTHHHLQGKHFLTYQCPTVENIAQELQAW